MLNLFAEMMAPVFRILEAFYHKSMLVLTVRMAVSTFHTQKWMKNVSCLPTLLTIFATLPKSKQMTAAGQPAAPKI